MPGEASTSCTVAGAVCGAASPADFFCSLSFSSCSQAAHLRLICSGAACEADSGSDMRIT
jgi:hypothetical protein